MRSQIGFCLLAIVLLTVSSGAAQQPKVYRVGVLLPGSPWYEAIDGLRQGLRELGLEEGKHFVLEIRDTKGNVKAAEAAAIRKCAINPSPMTRVHSLCAPIGLGPIGDRGPCCVSERGPV